jgi:hypothetical protein
MAPPSSILNLSSPPPRRQEQFELVPDKELEITIDRQDSCLSIFCHLLLIISYLIIIFLIIWLYNYKQLAHAQYNCSYYQNYTICS